MAQRARPVRADAARNRARILEVAYHTFAAEGLSVPIDEIARRAGVGAGTVYRNFPTKEALFQAVIADRMRHIIDDGHDLLRSKQPGEALFTFLRSMVLQWGAADRGLVEALAGIGIDINSAAPDAEADFRDLLAGLLHAAQRGRHRSPRRRGSRGENALGRVPGDAGLQRRVGRAGDGCGPRRPAATMIDGTPAVAPSASCPTALLVVGRMC